MTLLDSTGKETRHFLKARGTVRFVWDWLVRVGNTLLTRSATTYSDFQKIKQIPNLDGLRAISILMVIFVHIPEIDNPFQTFKHNSKHGVTLFFVISGFLICTLALREFRKTGRFSLSRFYIRRSLRLFPLYYATIALACFLVFVLNVYPPDRRQQFAERLPSFIFYYANIKIYYADIEKMQGPFTLLWSLSVEEQFYVSFALCLFIFKKRITGLLVLGVLIIQTQTFYYFEPTLAIFQVVQIIFSFFEPICLGVLLAYVLDHPYGYRFFARFFSNYICLVLVVIGIIFLLFHKLTLVHLFYYFLTLLVGICALSKPLPVLGGKLMSYIGKISYGIYLLHTIILYGVRKYITVDPLWTFCLVTSIVIFAASLSYEYFETPFLKLKKRFDGH